MTPQPDPFPPPTGAPVLTDGPPAAASRRPTWATPVLWISLAVMAIGVLGLLAAGADWAARTWEMNQLVSRIEASEAAMGAAQESIGAVPLADDASATQEAEAKDALRSASAAGREAVSATGDDVAALTFLPWHTEQIAAQGAYLAHNQAWVDYLERGATDPLTLFDGDNMIEPTWVRAESAVRAALPTPPLPPLPQRVDEIFREDDAAEPSPDGIPA